MGKRIARYRKERGWTQEQLAVRAGLSRPHLVRLEAGLHDPKASALLRLATVLGCTVDDLLR